MTEQSAFSIIDSYLRVATEEERIVGFLADQYYWRDLGRPEQIAEVAEDIDSKRVLLTNK
jgi:NDP-sugar pyrophosphorylase family protein